MKVKDIMHRGATSLDVAATVSQVARRMRDEDVGAIPVRSNGKLVGMITDRDVACRATAEGVDPDEMKAADIMTKGAICCAPDDDADEAIALMQRRQIRRLPVVESERLVGMLSLGDVSYGLGETLSGATLRAVSSHHA